MQSNAVGILLKKIQHIHLSVYFGIKAKQMVLMKQHDLSITKI